MRLAVFSLCSNQGVPQAGVLFDTVKRCLPEADRFLILADARHPAVPYPDGCVVIAADELGIADFQAFAFRYDPDEFAAGLKPFAFRHLLGARGYSHCLYFDPDMELFSPLPAVRQALEANAAFILTPHILAPAERADGADDIAIMQAGTFNLGFLGVSGTAEAHDRLGWWARWLTTHCVNDRPIGLFIDQKFMDLMPGLAAGTRILRDPSLNLAYWNLPQRRFVPDAAGGPTVDGHPLGFFHYSGFDPATPDRLGPDSAPLPQSWRRFLAGYAERLRASGHGRVPAGCYAYGRFASGVPIPVIARRMFRDDYPAWAGDPFESFEDWAHLAAPGTVPGIGSAVPSLMMQWLQARDSRLVRFPLSDPVGAAHVTRWWIEQGALAGMDPRFRAPIAAAAGLRPISARTSLRASLPAPAPGRADATVIAPFDEQSPAGRIGQAQRISLGLAAGRVEACNPGAAEPGPISGGLLGLCLAPERLAPVLGAIGRRLPHAAYRIFIPSAERIVLAPPCRAALAEIDEIWAPTRFIQALLVLATEAPVLHMPVAWAFPAAAAGAPPLSRPYVLAEDDAFPGGEALRAGIAAYAAAFGSRPAASRPVLAVRAEVADEPLRDAIAALDGVILPADTDPAALIAGAACLLALHRGEALGDRLLQAMASGVPVVATEFGGCTDWLTPKTGFPVEYRLVPADVPWAEADPDHAAWLLREVFDRPEIARERAEEGRRRVRSLHDPAAVAVQQARRLGLVDRLAARAAGRVAA